MLFEPTSILKEYTLRIVPPEPILSDVKSFKESFKKEFGSYKFTNSTPHITIAGFNMYEEYEDKLVKSLYERLVNIKKFQLEITGIILFLSGVNRTIVLDIIDNENIIKQTFNKALDTWVIDMRYSKSSIKPSIKSHITISDTRKEIEEQFFQGLEYSKSFEVNQLKLVSRKANNLESYKKGCVFNLS